MKSFVKLFIVTVACMIAFGSFAIAGVVNSDWQSEYGAANANTIAYWSLNADTIEPLWSTTASLPDPLSGHQGKIRQWSNNTWQLSQPGKFGLGIDNPGGATADSKVGVYQSAGLFPVEADPSLSIEAWVKFNDTTSRQFIISKGNAWSTIGGYDMWYDSGNLKFSVGNGTAKVVLSTSWTPASDEWYHLAGTWDADDDTARLWVGSDMIGSKTSAGLVIENSTRELALASRTTSTYANLNGSIDDVMISNVAYSYIPEPATMALLGLGGFSVLRRKRK